MNEISFKLPNSHQKMKRLVYLDSLRGFAAVWVVFYHMIFLAKPNLQTPDWLSFLRVGGMGVTIFYIISSFSLCLTMPRHISTGKYLKSFYIHRAFRILPLFYVVLLASVYFLEMTT